jgi:PadR family transcriptional regulator AphA
VSDVPERLDDLSVTEWAVLGAIAEGRTHGFSVARGFEPTGQIGKVWTVPRPLVYRAIDALAEHGLIGRVGSVPGAGGPPRTLLEATAIGSARVRTWLDEPITHVRDARSHLLLKLLMMDRLGADPSVLIDRQRAMLDEMRAGLTTKLAAASGFDEVLLRWRLYSTENLDRFLCDVRPRALEHRDAAKASAS